jgi:hypothetical protein
MNRTLAIFADAIPYVKELREITGSVTAAILMQQLDYRFDRYPDGFYKFLEPSEHSAYRAGDSWTEELGFSKEEFRNAFDKIGIRYMSRTQYLEANKTLDRFKGKFYCSVFDRKTGVTTYFRNHDLTDDTLDSLVREKPGKRRSSNLHELTNSISVNRETQFTDRDIPNIPTSGNPISPLLYTEKTTENTQKRSTDSFLEEKKETLELKSSQPLGFQVSEQRSEEVKPTPSVNPKTCHRESRSDNKTVREGVLSANSPKKENSFDEVFALGADFWPVHDAPWRLGERSYVPDMISAVDYTGGAFYRLEKGGVNETAVKHRLRKLEASARENFGQASIDARAALLDYWEQAQKMAAKKPESETVTPTDEPVYIPASEGLALMRKAMAEKSAELRRARNAG